MLVCSTQEKKIVLHKNCVQNTYEKDSSGMCSYTHSCTTSFGKSLPLVYRSVSFFLVILQPGFEPGFVLGFFLSEDPVQFMFLK